MSPTLEEIDQLWTQLEMISNADTLKVTLDTPGPAGEAHPATTVAGNVKEPDLARHEPADEFEAALKESFLTKSSFEVRANKLAYEFDKAKKADPDLHKRYTMSGNNSQKAIFRKNWAAEQWENVVRHRVEINEVSQTDDLEGRFKPVRKWVDDLGGNEEALRGVAFFLKQVCDMPEAERHKFLRRSRWTSMLTIAIPEESWNEGHARKWRLEEHSTQAKAKQTPNESQQRNAKRAIEEPDGASAPKKAPSRAAVAKASSPTKDVASMTPQDLWKVVMTCKAKQEKLSTMIGKLERMSATTDGAWMKKLDEFHHMTSKKCEIETHLAKDPFWVQLDTLPIATMKKDTSRGSLENAISSIQGERGLNKDIDALEEDTLTMQRLFRAKPPKGK